MKEILLTHGKVAIVDDDDYMELMKHTWHYVSGKGLEYCATSLNGKETFMHRMIMNTPKGMHTDHINHNGLDNRRCNLRIATNSQNQANGKLRKDNTN